MVAIKASAPTKTVAKPKMSAMGKRSVYKTVGRTSDGITVIAPKAATTKTTAAGRKIAKLMAANGLVVRTWKSPSRKAAKRVTTK